MGNLDKALHQIQRMTPLHAERTAISTADDLIKIHNRGWPTCVGFAAAAFVAVALYVVAFAPEDLVGDRSLRSMRERIAVRYALLAERDSSERASEPPIPLPDHLHGRFCALHVLPVQAVLAEAARHAIQALYEVEREQHA